MRPSLALALALALAVVAAAPAAAADPAETALRARDAYVSARAVGAPAAPEAERRLAEAARRLRAEGRPVKLAVVAGPVGAPSMRAYARRLRRALGVEATVVVTAPRRPVVAVGEPSPAEVTRRLRSARAGRVADPVDRVIAAARAVAPGPAPGGANVRELGALLGVAVLGGVWAVAIGLRRERLRARRHDEETRQALHVEADALGAQLVRLAGADRPADGELAVARERHAAARKGLMAARDAGTLGAVRRTLDEGLAALARARRDRGLAPLRDPLDGLCDADPAHGPADQGAPPRAGAPRLCGPCRDRLAAGDAPERRRVLRDGRPVPHSAAGLGAPPPG